MTGIGRGIFGAVKVLGAIVIVAVLGTWLYGSLTGSKSPAPAAPSYTRSPETVTAHDQCKAWYREGYSRADVSNLIATWIAGNSAASAQSDAVIQACAKGFVDGGG